MRDHTSARKLGNWNRTSYRCSFLTYVLLQTVCIALGTASSSVGTDQPILAPLLGQKQAFIRVPTSDEAWQMLPPLESGSKQALPVWARAVATQMPRTAAAMLELDAVHRLRSPLDPVLRAKLRWAIAHANRCSYSQAYAIADLRRAGAEQNTIDALTQGKQLSIPPEQQAMEFVRQLTTEAPRISDDLFGKLRFYFGDRATAAMVLLAAYGNFQDRILLGLNLELEEDGPFPACDVRFVEGALQVGPLLPPDNGQAIYRETSTPLVPTDQDWMSVGYEQLQQRLELQRDRKPRLPVPLWDDVKGNLPAAMAAKPTAIRWSLMNYGYAHELAVPWTICTRTHWAECPAERILEESLFWVQTRAIECNYCMGHCEMLLEVAGLDKEAVAKRTRLLAETDWSSFPPEEQRAYAFARKLSRVPWEMTVDDYRSLESDWGPKKAMGIFWWLCRGLYMTRISDGFQLPLERDNVFGNYPSSTKVDSVDPKKQ